MEAVRRALIDLDLERLASAVQRRLHRIYLGQGDALIRFAIETEHWRLHLGRKRGRALWPDRCLRVRVDERAVECDARLKVLVVGSVFPDRAPAAAEAHDAESVGVPALRLSPRRSSVEVREKLGVRLAVDDRHELRHFGDLGEILALAEIIIRRNGECAELSETPRDVLDVFVQSEN